MQLAVLGDTYQDFELPIKNRSHLACSIRYLACKKKINCKAYPLAFSQSVGAGRALPHRREVWAAGWREGWEGGTGVLEGEM